MTYRSFLHRGLSVLALLAASAMVPGGAAAQEGGSTLNYDGADLAAVARDIAFRTGRTFVIDPRLSGRVNIVSPPGVGLNADEVWEVFLATLQVNGFAAVPIGDREYKIVPSNQAIRDGREEGQSGPGGTTVTRVVPLRYVNAQSAAANLRGIASENSVVTPIAESNSLIIVDSATNMARLLSVVQRIDVDDSIVRTIPLRNAAAADVERTLRDIISRPGNEGGRAAVSVVAIDASNSIVVRGAAEELQRVLPIIQSLDAETTSQVALDTIYLDHADGEAIVPIIQQLLEGAPTPGGAQGEAASAPARREATSIAFHAPTNSLIINAPPEQQRLIRSIVSRLDVRRPQVLIEAVVVEIANSTARQLGVQYVTGGGDVPISAASFGNTSPNVVSAAGAALFLGEDNSNATTVTTTAPDGTVTTTTSENFDQNDPDLAFAGQLVEAAVSDLLGFNGFLLGTGGEIGDGGVFGVIVSAIQSDGQSKVLSVPSVVLLDNETSRLQVGQEIPLVTGEAVGSDFQGGFRQIERRDIGVILEVTPQINTGNTVQLDVSLEVSSLSSASSFTEDVVTNESVVETVALAEDGQTLIIGGLIGNRETDSESKVPLLGDIPLLGNLFKGQDRSKEDSTLMIFIKPTIMWDGRTADSVTARKYDYVKQKELRRSRNGRAVLDSILEDYVGPQTGFVSSPPAQRQRGEAALDEPEGEVTEFSNE